MAPWIYDNIITPTLNFIQGAIDLIVSGIKLLITIVQGLCTVLLGILLAPFQVLWKTVQDVFSSIQQTLQGILQVFRGIFSGDMRTVLNGFKSTFKGVFDSLWSIAKAPLNLIIQGINALIRGANKISFDVPDWVPGIGGQKWGFNIPQIPLLAKGAVISQPTQAIIGEAGTEAVVPLENNLEWLDRLATMLASKLNTNGNVNVYLDGRLIQRQISKRTQQLAFATNGG